MERAIQETGNMIKTYKAAVMHNLKYDKLKLSHPLVPWMIKHAVAQVTRFQVISDGRTSYEKIKGRKSI